MATGFANLVIRQGKTESIAVVFYHGIIADGAATSASSTLTVQALPTALSNGTTLEFQNDNEVTGTVILNADASLGATSISGSFTGAISSGNSAEGPKVDLSGNNWRGQVKASHTDTDAIAPIDFDLANVANGEVILLFPSTVFEDQDFNVTVKDWQGIKELFPTASTPRQFDKINRLLPQSNPFYVYDVETYDTSDPPVVDRWLEGCVAVIAETTTVAA